MIARCVVLLLLAVAAGQASGAAEPAEKGWVRNATSWISGLWSRDAREWLERIGPALSGQHYQGTLITVSGTRIETMGVFHAADEGREQMRLVTLTGPRREVIRDEDMVMCIGTGIESVGYDSDPNGRWNPAGQFAAAGRLQGYKASLGERGRVAARDAQVVNLEPRDAWRYGYRLWLDRESGLPLRIALVSEDGYALEQMAFTDLTVGVRPANADLKPSTRVGLRRVQSLGSGSQRDPGWRIESPPPGFELRAARLLGDSVQLLYGDGLASVSIYIEPVAGNRHRQSTMRRGAVNAYSLYQGPRRIVAIGKVPAATVEYFARNARPRDARAADRK